MAEMRIIMETLAECITDSSISPKFVTQFKRQGCTIMYTMQDSLSRFGIINTDPEWVELTGKAMLKFSSDELRALADLLDNEGQ